MKTLFQTSISGRVPALPEKRFLIKPVFMMKTVRYDNVMAKIGAVIFLSFACCVCVLAAENNDGGGLGCLTVPSLSPGHILRPSSLFLQPGEIRKHSFGGTLNVSGANIWCYDSDRYMLDGEWWRSDVRLHYGVSDNLAGGVLLPFIGRTGGGTDSSIEDFHEFFGLGDGDRDQSPRNQCQVWIKNDDGTVRNVVEGDAWGIGDAGVFAVLKMPDVWAAPTIMIQGTLPTGDEEELMGLGAISLSLSVLGNRRIRNSSVNIYAGAGCFYCPEDEAVGVDLNELTGSGLLGLEYRCTSACSLLLQALVNSPVARDFGEFSDPVYELSGGIKYRWCDSVMLQLSLTENFFTFKNSADIAVHLGVEFGL